MLKLMKLAALALFALGIATATTAKAQIVNGDFEAGLSPWRLQPSPGYEATLVSGQTKGQALRLVRRTEDGSAAFGAVSQMFDAAPYQGKRVTVTFRARAAKPGRQIGVALRVDRPPGAPRGGFGTQPVLGADWSDYQVSTYVAPDAARLYIGLVVSGDGEGEFDDLRLATSEGPASPEALAYLDLALGLLRRHHYRAGQADWTTLTAEARAASAGARTPADVHSAVQIAIAALGERHSRLIPPAAARPPLNVDAPMPIFASIGGVGIARLPGLRGGDPEGPATQYRATLSSSIAAHAAAGGCGWIVDLRENGGGNMWPMLDGLDALLGDPPFGWFIAPGGRTSPWVRTANGRSAPGPSHPMPAELARQTATQPIAVLLGPHTGSSGEMAAMALIGRDRVRSFGQPTAGLSTGNSTFPLPDGAALVVTTTNAADRTGFQYEGPIQPDEAVALDAAEAAALRWLSEQGCKAAS